MTATLPHPFHQKVSLQDPVLKVRDLSRCLAFYTDVLGFKIMARDRSRAELSANGLAPALLVLEQEAGIAFSERQHSGLFHLAYLYPDRAALGDVLRHLHHMRYPLQGASDHGVSEAIYLEDPEGNGLELYVDRPSLEWPRSNGGLQMVSDPMDFDGVYHSGQWEAPVPYAMHPATILGHVHLKVADMKAWARFMVLVLGCTKTQEMPGAHFYGLEGYHHHFACNVWMSRVVRPMEVAGLQSVVMEVDYARLEQMLQITQTDFIPTVLEREDGTHQVVFELEGLEIRVACRDLVEED